MPSKNKQKSIKTNFIFNFIKVLLSLIFPLITFPYASRILLPEGIGKVDFANSIIAYFLLIASLGINTYAIREGAKVRDDKEKLSNFFQEIFIINTITTVIAYIALFLSIYMIPNFYEYRELLLITGLTIGFSTLGIEWLYGALEEYKYITIRAFIFNIISLILLFTCVKTQEDYVKYAIIQVISNVGSNIMNFINSRKFVSLRKTMKYNFKRHIKPIMVIFGLNLSCNIYMNFDKTCLGIISGDEAVGLYTVALKINRIVLSLITALGTVLLPRLSYYLENDNITEYKVLINKAFNFIFMFSLPAAIGLYLLSTPLINIMSGEKYLQADITMKILTAIIPIISISNLIAVQIFIPFGKEKYALISSSVAAIVNLAVNLTLIPTYGQSGAAIGTVLAEMIALIICIYLCRKIIELKNSTKYLKQYIGGTILITVTYFGISKLITSNILLIITMCTTGVIEYIIFLFICKNEYLIELYKQIKEKIFVKRKEEKV